MTADEFGLWMDDYLDDPWGDGVEFKPVVERKVETSTVEPDPAEHFMKLMKRT